MKKQEWETISDKEKLEYLKNYLGDESDRLEKRLYKLYENPFSPGNESRRSHIITTQMAYQSILWLLEGKLFD